MRSVLSAGGQPIMTREAFFQWAEAQDGRYEFDGFAPVAMVGGTINHARIIGNLHFALRNQLRGKLCEMPGPDAGVATVGDAVRYPDAVITCSKTPGTSRLVAAPVVIFEVLSPSSGRIDKLREYASISSLRAYVILEYESRSLTLHVRRRAGQGWTTRALLETDVLPLPDVGVSIAVADVYENVDLPPEPPRPVVIA